MNNYTERFESEIAEAMPPGRRAMFDAFRFFLDPKHDLRNGPLAEAVALAHIYHAVSNPGRGVNIAAPFLGNESVRDTIEKMWRYKFKDWDGELRVTKNRNVIMYSPVPGKGILDDPESGIGA